VKRHGSFDFGCACNFAGAARREMRLALGVFAVCIEKNGLDEQQVGTSHEFH
jgi:hypothetical protein